MNVGELYVHIYKHVLIYTFYIKLLCMHDAVTCKIVANYIALFSIKIPLRATHLPT